MRCTGLPVRRLTPFPRRLQVFEEAGVELEKRHHTHGCGGLLTAEFLACADQIPEDLKRAGDIDGVFLRLHGARWETGPGRNVHFAGIDVLGYQVPVAVVMDPTATCRRI